MTTNTLAPAGGREYNRRMADWYGLRPSAGRPCLRKVLGQRCIGSDYTARKHDWHDCLCHTAQQGPYFDHVNLWFDAQKHYVITTEPYDLIGEDISEFVAEMAELGITVTHGTTSPYYPGHTTLLILTAKT